jgi:NhaP-type Na+/H+ or K+/H+ antiporter
MNYTVNISQALVTKMVLCSSPIYAAASYKPSSCLLSLSLSHPISLPLGLRGAIAYALALNLQESVGDFASPETIRVLDTATLIIVLFTIVGLGASTLPLLTVCFFPKLH